MDGYPDNNPKTVLGVKKVPLHLVPPSVKHFLAEAFADGAQKYGPYNWRDKKVSSSVYIGALHRHIDAWWDGEDIATDSKKHHLAHALACIGILVDALATGNLIDDRPTPGAASRLQSEYQPPASNTVDSFVPLFCASIFFRSCVCSLVTN